MKYLAGEAGIRQFLDIGTGLPTANNTHEVAQQVAAQSRGHYVDNDPLVLVHARALPTSTGEGATDFIDVDVRDPDKIVQDAARTLDFAQPVALMMPGILGNVLDTDEARSIVNRLVAAVPSGSYLVINDGTDTNERGVEGARIRSDAGDTHCLRSSDPIARFFDRLELPEPGVVSTRSGGGSGPSPARPARHRPGCVLWSGAQAVMRHESPSCSMCGSYPARSLPGPR